MSEFIFVNLIDKEPVGSTLQSIPLHMTALHWFESDREQHEIIDATSAALQSIGRIAVEATKEDLFGPDQDVPVMRLDRSPELINVHVRLLESMMQLGSTFDERWVGESKWNPHVTHKSNGRLQLGDIVDISDIDLITHAPTKMERKL